jgi:hypothetical protein
MKSLRWISRWFDLAVWSAYAVVLVYLAVKGRVAWWVPAIGGPVGAVLMYFRLRYYVPFIDEARARRKARKNARPA